MEIEKFTFSLTRKQAMHVVELLTKAATSVLTDDLIIVEVSPLDVQVIVTNWEGKKVQIF